MTSTKFLLTNLNCSACGKVSQSKLSKISGVTSVRIDQSGSEARGEMDADRSIPEQELQEALSGTDYKIQLA